MSEDMRWYHLSICKNMDINWFYDDYESNPDLATNIDDICKSCPVRQMCLQEGIENEEHGVWGGLFLVRGKADATRNAHKTDEDWQEIRELITS